jgi:hypothetical protein
MAGICAICHPPYSRELNGPRTMGESKTACCFVSRQFFLVVTLIWNRYRQNSSSVQVVVQNEGEVSFNYPTYFTQTNTLPPL